MCSDVTLATRANRTARASRAIHVELKSDAHALQCAVYCVARMELEPEAQILPNIVNILVTNHKTIYNTSFGKRFYFKSLHD